MLSALVPRESLGLATSRARTFGTQSIERRRCSLMTYKINIARRTLLSIRPWYDVEECRLDMNRLWN
jgi:hypothetical protein